MESGEVLFKGRNLLSLTEKELDHIRGREIAMVFQDIMYSLNPVFTIGNQMTETLRKHMGMKRAQAWERAVELLEKTGIAQPRAVMRKYPHMLSGGMRQRVMIAMALTCNPSLLIADEPTTALDVTIQLQIMQLLKRLRDESGMAILLITHDIGLVTEIADRVVVMYAGECVEETTTQQLLEAPAHPYTQALLRAVPGIHDPKDRRLYSIPGTAPNQVVAWMPLHPGVPLWTGMLRKQEERGYLGIAKVQLLLTGGQEAYGAYFSVLAIKFAKALVRGEHPLFRHQSAVSDVSFDLIGKRTLGLSGESVRKVHGGKTPDEVEEAGCWQE